MPGMWGAIPMPGMGGGGLGALIGKNKPKGPAVGGGDEVKWAPTAAFTPDLVNELVRLRDTPVADLLKSLGDNGGAGSKNNSRIWPCQNSTAIFSFMKMSKTMIFLRIFSQKCEQFC